MSAVLRLGAIGAAMAALAFGVAFAQETRQPRPINPLDVLQEQLRQRLQRPTTAQAVLPANGGWTNSGVNVERGARLQITAQGQWSAVSNARLAAANQAPPSTDANGYPGRTAPNAPLPNANLGALIGRIGDGAPFLIGANYRGEANAAGPLMLAMNDFNFADNQGRLSIAVAATPPPPPVRPQPQPQTPAQETTPTRPQPQDNAETPTRPQPQPETPVVETPPTTRVPETPQPETPAPVAEEVAPIEETTTAPTETSAPAQAASPGAPAEPAQPTIPAGWAAAGLAALLVALALVVRALRPPRRAPRRAAPTGRVGARVAHDGRDGQWLKVSWT